MLATLSALVAAELNRVVTNRAIYAGVLAFALVFALFGLGFGLVAVRDWISTALAAPYPNLIVAAGLIVIAAAVAGAGAIWKNRRQPSMLAPAAAAVLAPTAARLVGRSVTPRLLVVGTVVIAGIWLGRRARGA